MDCSNGESFGFDTLRLKENNLRIKFQDTSNSASFPTVDWQLTANDSSNGGLNKFSIDDIDSGRTPFTVEAGAPTNALYVDDGGRIGFGTSTPTVDLQVVQGNTPTLRLEQDGSSGFTPQTWDVAGNEVNFFVRDVTNGSKLSFRIRPGAPESSIDIAADGDVGIGTSSPSAPLHVRRTSGTAKLVVEEASGTQAVRELLHLKNNGGSYITLENSAATGGGSWYFTHENSSPNRFLISHSVGGAQLALTQTGDLQIMGNFISDGTTLAVPDYVFAADYDLRPLGEVRNFIRENSHLPEVPSAAEIGAGGLNMSEMQLTLLKKIEELTLYAIEQDETIASLTARLDRFAE